MTRITLSKRIVNAYKVVGQTFGNWISPIFTGILLFILKLLVTFGLIIDKVLFRKTCQRKITNPILIVGNPRSGTTFLHRYLVQSKIGTGTQLWQMIYPSVILQKLIRPFLPILEKISPTRHHSTSAHKTSLTAVETDDASMLFRFFDGFFLYGFIFAWAEEDLFPWFDPKIRDMSQRDFDWFESLWIRVLHSSESDRIIGKLFSLSANLPGFQKRFPDAKVLYMVRDPLNVIPSGLSLVTGVLDKRFGFWNLPEAKRSGYILRMYKALVELLVRFHSDWENDRIDKSKVMIVRYDKMMSNFDDLMEGILAFLEYSPSNELMKNIQETAESQRGYQSNHKYDLHKFGLDEDMIRKDCAKIYEIFLS